MSILFVDIVSRFRLKKSNFPVNYIFSANEIQRFSGVDDFRSYASKKIQDFVFEEIGKESIVMVLVH